MTNRDTYDIQTYEKEQELKFRNFQNPTVNCIPLHDWIDEYNFQREDYGHPFIQANTKIVTILVWSCSGYFSLENKTYPGMYSYAEVYSERTGERWYKSFFGEESVDNGLRWASDISYKVLYV